MNERERSRPHDGNARRGAKFHEASRTGAIFITKRPENHEEARNMNTFHQEARHCTKGREFSPSDTTLHARCFTKRHIIARARAKIYREANPKFPKRNDDTRRGAKNIPRESKLYEAREGTTRRVQAPPDYLVGSKRPTPGR